MVSIQIRPALPADQFALAALDTVAASEPQRIADIRDWLAQGAVYLAMADGEVAGYGVLHAHFFGRSFLELVMVGVAHRHKGIGSALIAHALTNAKSAELWTSTNQSNIAMQGLLTRMGFAPSGMIENLDEGDPELIFRAIAAGPDQG